MATYQSPGIYIEETNNSAPTVQAVGTSTVAIVGWTERGPTNTATLIGNPSDYQRAFGEYTNDSLVPIEVLAFFANGGSRAYVVRVTPTDATIGESCITEDVLAAPLGLGTGSTLSLSNTLSDVPLRKGSVEVEWRNNPLTSVTAEVTSLSPAAGEAVVDTMTGNFSNSNLIDTPITIHWTEALQATDTFTLGGTPADGQTITIDTTVYTFNTVLGGAFSVLIGGSAAAAIANLYSAITAGPGIGINYGTSTSAHPTCSANSPSGLTMLVWALTGGTAGNAIAATTTVTAVGTSWSSNTLIGGTAAVAKTATLGGVSTVGGANASRILEAAVNRPSGEISIQFNPRTIGTNNGPAAGSLTFDYSFGGAVQSVTDDGLGNLSLVTPGGTTVAGTIDYATGALTVTWTSGSDLPFSGNLVVANYSHCLWQMEAANPGQWSGRMIMTVAGNPNYFTYGTQSVAGAGTYSKFDVTIAVQNTVTGQFEVKETYDESVFDDTTDPAYFPEVMEKSSYVVVTDLGALDVPSSFKGLHETNLVATGDSSTTAFTSTLSNFPVVKSSLQITYTPNTSGLRTLTANASGAITGAGLDPSKTNTINYATGALTLNFLAGANAPGSGAAITALYIASPETSSVSYSFTGGSNGTLSGSTFDRGQFTDPDLAASKLGMFALNRVDEVMQLIIPDFAGDITVAGDQLDYAEGRGDIFVILSTPKGMDGQDAADYQSITFGRKSKYAAMYWPWIDVTDPLNSQKTLTIPPHAHIAGVYARTDKNKNVGKAPGGTVDGALQFLSGLESNPDKGERDTVYPVRVNPLINTTQTGLAVWGVRTMSPTSDVLKYVNAVRLFQFVEKSVFNSTFGFVFESITPGLYTRIKTTIDGFLNNLFQSGYLAGSTPLQAYFVVCDHTNNPPEVVNQGQVIVDIGIAPNKPAEFIIFRFSPISGNS